MARSLLGNFTSKTKTFEYLRNELVAFWGLCGQRDSWKNPEQLPNALKGLFYVFLHADLTPEQFRIAQGWIDAALTNYHWRRVFMLREEMSREQ